MKLLFLDIDSVLNVSCAGEDLYFDGTIASPYLDDKLPLCTKNINSLKYILAEVPDLKIIWSTDWRLYDKPTYNGWLNPRQWLETQEWMKDRIVGKTPKKMSSTHYEEIRMWFTENDYCAKNDGKACMDWIWPGKHIDVEKFAILDDYVSPEMLRYFKDSFFQCQHDTGLTMEIAKNVVAHLKGN